MNEKVNQIIDELINSEPAFGAHRNELEKILMSVISARPETVIDSAFVRKLKLQLLEQLDNKSAKTGFWSGLKENFMKKTILSAASVIVVLLVAIVTLQAFGDFKKQSGSKLLSFGSDVRITHASDKAFGSLATLSLAQGGSGGGGASPATAALGAEGTRSSVAYGMGGGSGVAVSDKMIAPYEPVTYKYIYKGDELNLSADKLNVLKKQTPNTTELASSLNSLGLGLVNLNSFPGSKVQSISFNQDNAYNIYVDLTSGVVSISGYYDYLAMEKSACGPEGGCPTPIQNPVKESDIPADEELISVANQFLSEHGISTAAYGAPEVSNDYRDQIRIQLQADPKSLVYWPEYINVIYPLKIENEAVFDEGGNKTGLMVGVGIRSKKVMSVWNLTINDYQASSYDAETNVERILKVAQSGGMYGWLGEGGKVVEIELGTPTIQYVQMWDYKNNFSQQLLVPSLVFPVTKQPTDGYFYRKSVVVPLIKDILDRDTNGGSGGGIMPRTLEVDANVK